MGLVRGNKFLTDDFHMKLSFSNVRNEEVNTWGIDGDPFSLFTQQKFIEHLLCDRNRTF